ncbi:hypothetical protein SH661x_001013 [Planctomicrobium sp. SH661]|uniref:hypothetical protein n=1 Tax=Planctomicrobium sp. SH661 TaxID=3448124 RepID=UPI003F5B7496
MRRIAWGAWLAGVLVCSPLSADEPPGTPQAIVQAWMKASEERGPFEAEGHHFRYHKISQTAEIMSMHCWTLLASGSGT